MQYLYAAIWFAIGLLLIFSIAREDRIFYLPGGYFIFMGLWRLLDTLLKVSMFSGIPGIIFKVISGLMLAVLVIYLLRKRKKAKP